METAESSIEKVVVMLQKLDGAPAIALVFVSCLVLGYVLKMVPKFPNQGIPLAVILWGCIVNPVLADMNVAIPLRIWMIRGLIVGGTTGFVAWLFHAVILSKVEDKLGLLQTPKPQTKDTPDETPTLTPRAP